MIDNIDVKKIKAVDKIINHYNENNQINVEYNKHFKNLNL